MDPQSFEARLTELLSGQHPVAAGALVTPHGTSLAIQGAELDATFEIGSISKGVTGLLYVDALDRGEVTGHSTLGELLPLGDVPAAAIQLSDLSIHRSGLPRLPRAAHPVRRTIELWRHGTNPYGEDLGQLLAQAREVTVGKPKPAYSNLGYELLGHAVAAAAGTTYADLVASRIARPLGLDSVHVPARDADLRPNDLTGTNRRGKPQQPWTGEALGPAGGIRATIGDLATLTRALLDGTAPGTAALDPTHDFGPGARVGAAWVTVEVDEREITWHNGGTGGFRAWLGLDRAAGKGAVLVSATTRSVDQAGFKLIL